jgi:alginate O-acetyltransferase complex protein AlgI
MLFNTSSFALFLPIVFLLYWFVTNKSLKIQNILLLVASYFFYSCWDWRFLFLLIFSTFLDYYTGLKISDSTDKTVKKRWFWLSIIVNLGFLGVFKYYNFFATSFAEAIYGLGFEVDIWTLSVILPVGISFYTFHGVSYVIDIYKDRIKAERDFIDYSVFVSFFPLLVAGPIERATHLLPQLKVKRNFDKAKAILGLRQILWGLFKKVVIADNCAEYANAIFSDSASFSGSTLVFGVVFFTIQIYGDFSGYTDIAIGTARLFGIDLLRNFAFPYFSRDIAEFWRRWHISLSSWFRDYLYVPLGGSKGGLWLKIRNMFIIFLVSGFWHGANWTYIIWGLLNAFYMLPSILFSTNRNNIEIVAHGRILPTTREFFHMSLTFSLVVFAFIIFRANSMGHAFEYMEGICNKSLFSVPEFYGKKMALITTLYILILIVVEWIDRESQFGLENKSLPKNKFLRWTFYYFLIGSILYFSGKEVQFIYFQF